MARRNDLKKAAMAGVGIFALSRMSDSAGGSAPGGGNDPADYPGTSEQPDGFPDYAYGPYLHPDRETLWRGVRVPDGVPAPQSRDHPDYPKAFAITDRNAPLFEIGVHQDQQMWDDHGSFPQKRIARHLADAFEAHGFNYVIGFGHNPYEYALDSENLLDKFYSWDETLYQDNLPHEAKDCNLLLAHNGESGGGHSWGPGSSYPQASVAACGGMSQQGFSRSFKNETGYGRAVHSSMHEVMHNLGIGHANEGNSGGLTWLDDDNSRWYRSPTAGTPDSGGSYTNICGEDMGANPQSYPTWTYAGYTRCSVENAVEH